jgi:hypothetical protein
VEADMQEFEVAYVKEQNVTLVVILVDDSYGRKPDGEQIQILRALQFAATSAGLAGTVVPIWFDGRTLGFRAPRNWHAFFGSIGPDWFAANRNRSLTIS